MLGRIFIALCSLPGLKKKLWQAWYDYLAASHRAPEWTFMNYGYAAPGAEKLALAEADEPDRHWIQLYDHVAGAVDLTGCTVLEVGSGRGGGSSFIKRITPNVVAALDHDNDRKIELIHRLIPSILRRSFLDFAAVRGSALFEAFRSGKVTYMSFVLCKAPLPQQTAE